MRRMGRMLAVMALAVLVPAAGAVGGQVYFYHTDPAGTPIAMSDASGNVVWRADYRPFGEIQTESGTAPNDKLFVGKEKDDETGLYYFGARYMDDRIGRFIAPDPVGPVDAKNGRPNEKLLLNPQRLNPYAYALNNPYRYIDPDGNLPFTMQDYVNSHPEDTSPIASIVRFQQWCEENRADLSRQALADAVSTIVAPGAGVKTVGQIVLGRYPAYLQKAGEIGGRVFNIPAKIWERMTEAQRWAANQKFLDRAIARGDEILLGSPVSEAKPGTQFAKELEYLSGKGFKPNAEGTRLIRGE